MARLEIAAEKPLLAALRKQEWYADKLGFPLKAGRPDWRLSHAVFGPLDVEFKVSQLTERELGSGFVPTGITKLQWLKMREMNAHGLHTVGLVYLPLSDEFVITDILRDDLTGTPYRFKKLPKPWLIHGGDFYHMARGYLHERPDTRHRA